MVGVSQSLAPVRANDVLVINMGAHYRCGPVLGCGKDCVKDQPHVTNLLMSLLMT